MTNDEQAGRKRYRYGIRHERLKKTGIRATKEALGFKPVIRVPYRNQYLINT
jgi:hypothetical protein